MPTIYLHIGRGKTGTTALQRYMAAAQETMLAAGVHYVRAAGGGRGSGHQDFAKSFIRDLPRYMTPPRRPEAAREAVADEIRRSAADHIVLSSENFELADSGDVRRYFARLLGSYRITIIYLVRSQDELAESEYNQMLKLKREVRSFADYLENELEGYDYNAVAGRWERYFGRENMICGIYDAARSDIVSQFLASLPVDLCAGQREAISGVNASIGIKACIAARILNTLGLDDRQRLYDLVLEGLADNDIPALWFDSDQARRFRQRFAASNKAFTGRYVGPEHEDLRGRRYTDERRDEIRARIRALKLDSL